MGDYQKWTRDSNITTTKDIEKGIKYQDEIANLVRKCGGNLEQKLNLSPLTPILVRMENRPPGDTRYLPEIKHLEQELPSILRHYGLEIEEFNDSDISKDGTFRRITIRVRKT